MNKSVFRFASFALCLAMSFALTSCISRKTQKFLTEKIFRKPYVTEEEEKIYDRLNEIRDSRKLPAALKKFSAEALLDKSLSVEGSVDCPSYGSGVYMVQLTGGKKNSVPLAMEIFTDARTFKLGVPGALAGYEVLVFGVFDVDGSGFGTGVDGFLTRGDLLFLPEEPHVLIGDDGVKGLKLGCVDVFGKKPGMGPIIGKKTKRPDELVEGKNPGVILAQMKPLPLAKKRLGREQLMDRSLPVKGVVNCPQRTDQPYMVMLGDGNSKNPPVASGIFQGSPSFQFRAPAALGDMDVTIQGLIDMDGSGFEEKPSKRDLALFPDILVQRVDSKSGLTGLDLKCRPIESN